MDISWSERPWTGSSRSAGWLIFCASPPLKLKTALNLDGGPVACQGISLDGFARNQCGKFEMRNVDGRFQLLVRLFGERPPPMPIVLAVFPK